VFVCNKIFYSLPPSVLRSFGITPKVCINQKRLFDLVVLNLVRSSESSFNFLNLKPFLNLNFLNLKLFFNLGQWKQFFTRGNLTIKNIKSLCRMFFPRGNLARVWLKVIQRKIKHLMDLLYLPCQ
jgi:hypothetical protein